MVSRARRYFFLLHAVIARVLGQNPAAGDEAENDSPDARGDGKPQCDIHKNESPGALGGGPLLRRWLVK
jgi:hypothetical protein